MAEGTPLEFLSLSGPTDGIALHLATPSGRVRTVPLTERQLSALVMQAGMHLLETAKRRERNPRAGCSECGHRTDEHECGVGCARCACERAYWGDDEQ